MTDLDERILKKNVPNKFSQWNETNEFDSNPISDNGDIDAANPSNRRSTRTVRSTNTGAKGVLQDYRDAKQSNALQESLDHNHTQESLRRLTSTCVMKPGETSVSLASIKIQNRSEGQTRPSDSESDSDSDDGGDSDGFLESYRQKRILQMQETHLKAQRRTDPFPVFGTVKDVQVEQFTAVVDEMDPRVYCVFHLYRDGVPSCALTDHHMATLAHAMDYSSFYRMRISDIRPNFDPIGFPCVLVYRAGVEVANLTPLTRHIPSWCQGDRFTMENVRYVLELHGVVDPTRSC